MTVPGEPHAVARETTHVGAERAVVVQVHARNEELVADLEEEETGIVISP